MVLLFGRVGDSVQPIVRFSCSTGHCCGVAVLFPAAQIGSRSAAVQQRRHGFCLGPRSDLNISMLVTFGLTNKICRLGVKFRAEFGLVCIFFFFWHPSIIESVVKFCLRSRFEQGW